MYKTILVPLDLSQRAEAILPHVENLAQRYGATVVLLYVEEVPMMLERDEVVDWEQFRKVLRERRQKTEAYLDAIITEWQKKEISVRKRIGQGPVVKCIVDSAAEEKASLVAMSSHGSGGMTRSFYGSVAAGVLQHIDRPLLLIRSRFNAIK
jgi:nucleotide-binding universal stress UspA family protein